MTLSTLASIATILEAAFVILSVCFIWYQLRINAELARVSNAQSLVELSSTFNLQLMQDPEITKLWVTGAREFDGWDDVQKYRFMILLYYWLNLHENIFFQWQRRVMDQYVYKSWQADLERFIVDKELWRFWSDMEMEYQPTFRRHVTELCERFQPQPKPVLQSAGDISSKT